MLENKTDLAQRIIEENPSRSTGDVRRIFKERYSEDIAPQAVGKARSRVKKAALHGEAPSSNGATFPEPAHPISITNGPPPAQIGGAYTLEQLAAFRDHIEGVGGREAAVRLMDLLGL